MCCKVIARRQRPFMRWPTKCANSFWRESFLTLCPQGTSIEDNSFATQRPAGVEHPKPQFLAFVPLAAGSGGDDPSLYVAPDGLCSAVSRSTTTWRIRG